MKLNDYISQIEVLLHECVIISGYDLRIDRKTTETAFISAKVTFRDGTVLDFKEFIDVRNATIEKFKYAYNYRSEAGLIFRYDNARDPRARNLSTYPDHKHVPPDQIVESHLPELTDVLDEIEHNFFSKQPGLE